MKINYLYISKHFIILSSLFIKQNKNCMNKLFFPFFKKLETIFTSIELTLEEKFQSIADEFVNHFDYAKGIKIYIEDNEIMSHNFVATTRMIQKDIRSSGVVLGSCFVYLDESENSFNSDEFEIFLILLIDKFASYLFINKLEKTLKQIEFEKHNLQITQRTKYAIVLELLKNTDRNLYTIITRKMLNFLLIKGIKESSSIFEKLGSRIDEMSDVTSEINRPTKKQVLEQIYFLANDIFALASKYLDEDFIVNQIQRWINDENAKLVTKTLNDPNASLFDIGEAVRRYYKMNPNTDEDKSAQSIGMVVSLIRRFFSEQLEFINIAKNFFDIKDFYQLLPNIIFASESYGTVGGKSSGILLASKIIEKEKRFHQILNDIKIPRTWLIPSDGETNFIYYNNLEDVIEQKYRSLEEIRKEYPYTMQVFKNSQFPEEMINGLSRVLDEVGDNPIVVRSSSLLEDRMGTAFAGKYKSLFLANQGKKKEKLDALLDAIAEVYASVFSPDPISYRKEMGLLDFNEGMGIIIQEVVGTKVGNYYFPAFAGVGFSNNEFRWSPRIKREDGLLRLVPGLGTRAVDRVGNDFPILISPGQMDLRVNLNVREAITYSPHYIDVINLEKNTFETIELRKLIKDIGNQYPMINEVFSIVEHNNIKAPVGLGIDTKKDDIIVTFDNLVRRTPYVKKIGKLIEVLKQNFQLPVDIEFACDGKNLYLLQCRQQSSYETELSPSVIPDNIPKENILFTANKYVSNAKVPDIAYIVYVEPQAYYNAKTINELEDTAKAISKLNQSLPKKSFILIGPGRWGTRDDIRLGVKISYSDINNTAMLIEVAKSKNGYTPELSFGTHFFQDLVESRIYYLPLYPEQNDTYFNFEFFKNAENVLERYISGFDHLSDIVKVINVREITNGKILRVLMNSDEEKAVAYFTSGEVAAVQKSIEIPKINTTEAQIWRTRMVEGFVNSLDTTRFGVVGIYLTGSVLEGNAKPNSDIDIVIHFQGTEQQKNELLIWCEGWNLSLSHINYNRSGFKIERLLDVLLVDDNTLQNNKFYADLINPAKMKSKRLK